jgi:hypothetical protein
VIGAVFESLLGVAVRPIYAGQPRQPNRQPRYKRVIDSVSSLNLDASPGE